MTLALMLSCSDCGADAQMEHASGKMLCIACAIAEEEIAERDLEIAAQEHHDRWGNEERGRL